MVEVKEMNTKIILALAAIATVAAALVGVTAAQAQFAATQTPTANAVNQATEPPCVTGNIDQIPEWCVNATTGEPNCWQNGTQTQNGYGYGYGCGGGCNQNGYTYDNQYMQQQRGRNGFGFGGCR